MRGRFAEQPKGTGGKHYVYAPVAPVEFYEVFLLILIWLHQEGRKHLTIAEYCDYLLHSQRYSRECLSKVSNDAMLERAFRHGAVLAHNRDQIDYAIAQGVYTLIIQASDKTTRQRLLSISPIHLGTLDANRKTILEEKYGNELSREKVLSYFFPDTKTGV